MSDVNFFSGKVTRLYPDRVGLYIQLNEQEAHYFLHKSHENYEAIFSMALSAAVGGIQFGIRISGKKYDDRFDLVEYVTMTFALPK